MLRQESWRPDEHGTLHCEAVITATGAPLTARGSAMVAATDVGSVLRFTGTLHVRIPIVGGAIEKFIVGRLGEEIPAAQRFTAEWIAANV